jgi:hypothetical protein
MSLKFYDSVSYDSEIDETLESYDCADDFEKWLEAVLVVEENKSYRNRVSGLTFTATYVIPESGDDPSVDLQVEVTTGCHSYSDSRHGDVDLDFLQVSTVEKKVYPLSKDVVLTYLKKCGEQHYSPTKHDIAKDTGLKVNDVHNILCEICYRNELVEEVPVPGKHCGYRLSNGKRQDPATLFRRASLQEKKQMLETATDVAAVVMMLDTLAYNGCLSPSSNVPDNLSAIFGDQPWPKIVSEAKTQLAKKYGKMWSYCGD